MEYMTRAGYNPNGMIGLMEMLNEQHDREPSALEVMFSTHPMSAERLATARRTANKKYLGAKEYSLYRERYMDNTIELRKIGPAIKQMQDAEKLLGEKKYTQAEEKMTTALQKTPNDYTGLLLMAKTQIVQERYNEALPYAMDAKRVYPGEPQATQISGVLLTKAKRYQEAYQAFSEYDKAMPGNPYVDFYKGFNLEGMGNRDAAAREYYAFLKQVNQGDQAKHAYSRLVQWGYVKQ